MSLGDAARKELRKLVPSMREVLTGDLAHVLECTYGIHRSGLFEPAENLPALADPRHRDTRELLQRMLPSAPDGKKAKEAFAEAFDVVLRTLATQQGALAKMLDRLWEHLALAAEVGSVLRVDEAMGAVIAEERKRWVDHKRGEQGFLPGMEQPQQDRLDFSDVSDDGFWQQAEAELEALLKGYAEEASGAEGLRRRLFARDSAEGLHFVEVLRTRFDVVLMNPPFGAMTPAAKPYVEKHNPRESSLYQVPKMFREPEELRRSLASCSSYHALDVGPRAPVRLPQPMRPASLPGRNGEDLVSCLFYLREAERDRFEAVEDALKAAFPGFERLDFPPVAAGTLAMTWRDRAFPKPIFTHELSEGMLRFLWLTALLQSPGLTALTLLDEPEVSLHPELLSLLAGLLREASERSQLVVATHSDRLVRFLEPGEVVVMDLEEDGAARATWADRLDLDRWLSEYTLDEVWRLGRMGGRA